MKLQEWCEKNRVTIETIEVGGCYLGTYVDTSNVAEHIWDTLWNLSDYSVSSCAMNIVWLKHKMDI